MRSFIILALTLFSITTFATDLTPSQKQFIVWGEPCCYSAEIVEDVLAQQHVDTFQPKVILDLPPFIEPATKLQWAMFYTLQILDIYSTDRAIQYSCVKEVNPLLGKTPTSTEIIALKVILIGPALYYAHKHDVTITETDLQLSNLVIGAVVANNFDVYSQAKKRDDCINIR